MGLPARSRRTRAAFTLLELMAVVVIMALISTYVAPSLSMLRGRRLNDAAIKLASHLELARQRTVVTGVPHRVWFDLEAAAYRLEWLGEEENTTASFLPEEYDVRGSTPLPLSAPTRVNLEFQPMPGNYGNFKFLEGDIFIAGLDTNQGWIDSGESWIGFDRDGSSAYTEIVVEDSTGDRRRLSVMPLDDAVRFVDEET